MIATSWSLHTTMQNVTTVNHVHGIKSLLGIRAWRIPMNDNHLPMLTNHQSCAEKGYDPEWWHPQELSGRQRNWSHTPEAELARSICSTCPAKQECRSYALKYFNLTGIWGGMDRLERHAMQKALGSTPIDWLSTYDSSVFSVPHERNNDGARA